MMTRLRFHPVRPGPTGFGFEAQMADPDFTRFPDWYATTNRYGHGAAPAATQAVPETGDATFDAAA